MVGWLSRSSSHICGGRVAVCIHACGSLVGWLCGICGICGIYGRVAVCGTRIVAGDVRGAVMKWQIGEGEEASCF